MALSAGELLWMFSVRTRLFEDRLRPGGWRECDMPFLPAEIRVAIGHFVARTGIDFATARISTHAGSASRGFGGLATEALFAPFGGLACDGSGSLFVSDCNHNSVRKVASDGRVTIVAGVAGGRRAGYGDVASSLNGPQGLAVDAASRVYIADCWNRRIRAVTPDGVFHTVAGSDRAGSGDGGQATQARLTSPTAVALGRSGELYISDSSEHKIRIVTRDGVIRTLAGDGHPGFSGDGAAATDAQLNSPQGVAVDSQGRVFIADCSNHRIRQVSADGVITTAAGNAVAGFDGDRGPATQARLRRPMAVALDVADNLFIADTSNDRVRRLSGSSGVIESVVGDGSNMSLGDGGLASRAAINDPRGLAFDSVGHLYISEFLGLRHRVRKVSII